ncbi:AzlC family ABC transporter permease [Helicobacter sp. 23-1044]
MSEASIALREAFKKDIEILFGYVSMGFCCGVLLKTSGFSAIYALIMSVFVYSGVMQFLAVSFFSAPATLTALLNIFLITLILNSRQSFYTLIMLEKFRAMDFRRFLNIFWLTDETFAILKTKKPKSNANHFIFFVSFLNYIYWGFGCVLGAVVGGFITFDTRGLEFIMTAIFVVIFIDNLKAIRTKKGYTPAIIGIATALFWLVAIGEQYFLLVALISSIAILGLCYRKKWDLGIESHLDSGESSSDSHKSNTESSVQSETAPISSLRESEATEAIQKFSKDSAHDSHESKRESTAK